MGTKHSDKACRNAANIQQLTQRTLGSLNQQKATISSQTDVLNNVWSGGDPGLGALGENEKDTFLTALNTALGDNFNGSLNEDQTLSIQVTGNALEVAAMTVDDSGTPIEDNNLKSLLEGGISSAKSQGNESAYRKPTNIVGYSTYTNQNQAAARHIALAANRYEGLLNEQGSAADKALGQFIKNELGLTGTVSSEDIIAALKASKDLDVIDANIEAFSDALIDFKSVIGDGSGEIDFDGNTQALSTEL